MSGSAGLGSGHGTTITFASLGSYSLRSVTLHSESGPPIDISGLGSNSGAPGGARTYLMPDLTDLTPFTAEILYDTDHQTGLPAFGTTETVTVTFPIRVSGNTTNATLSANAFVQARDFGSLQSNVEQVATFSVQWSVRPTWSAEAA